MHVCFLRLSFSTHAATAIATPSNPNPMNTLHVTSCQTKSRTASSVWYVLLILLTVNDTTHISDVGTHENTTPSLQPSYTKVNSHESIIHERQ